MTSKPKNPGRGKRVCSGCGEIVGARLLVCHCGQKKESKIKSKAKTSPESNVIITRPIIKVRAPSGACPVPIKKRTRAGMSDWVNRLLTHGEENFIIYTEEAVLYHLKYELGLGNKDFSRLSKYVVKIMAEKENG